MNAKTQAQYQNIDGNDLAQFKDAGTQAVVSPSNFASGQLVYPYAKAKRRI
jgi:branched-chain amino acid transport system substrate-binding protein